MFWQQSQYQLWIPRTRSYKSDKKQKLLGSKMGTEKLSKYRNAIEYAERINTSKRKEQQQKQKQNKQKNKQYKDETITIPRKAVENV